MKHRLIEEYSNNFHRLSGTQVLLEDFRTAFNRFTSAGFDPKTVKAYLDAFKIIKNKGYSPLKDSKDRIERVTQKRFLLKEPPVDRNNPGDVEKLKLFRSNIDNYEDFQDVVNIVTYIKSQSITDINDEDLEVQIDGKIIYSLNRIEIYHAPSGHACFTYRTNKKTETERHYGWCIAAEPSSNAYGRYRFGDKKYTIYFVHSKDKPISNKWHVFVVQVAQSANINNPDEHQYLVTSSANDGDNWWSFKDILAVEPLLIGTQHLFKPIPLSPGEQRTHQEFQRAGQQNYCQFTYRRKQTFIDNLGDGQNLNDAQFECSPESLISYYIDTGRPLSETQYDLIKNNKNLNRRYVTTTFGRFIRSDGSKELYKNQINILLSADIGTIKSKILPIILKNIKNIENFILQAPYDIFSQLKNQLITGLLAFKSNSNNPTTQEKIKRIDRILEYFGATLDPQTRIDLYNFRVRVQAPIPTNILSTMAAYDEKTGTNFISTATNTLLKKYIKEQGKEELWDSEALLLSKLPSDDFQKYIVPHLTEIRNIFLFSLYGVAGTISAMGKDNIYRLSASAAEELLHRIIGQTKFITEEDTRLLLLRIVEDRTTRPPTDKRIISQILKYTDTSDEYEFKITQYLDEKLYGDFLKLAPEHQDYLIDTVDDEYFREHILPKITDESMAKYILKARWQDIYSLIEKIGLDVISEKWDLADIDSLIDRLYRALAESTYSSYPASTRTKDSIKNVIKILLTELINYMTTEPLSSRTTQYILKDPELLKLALNKLIKSIPEKTDNKKLLPYEITLLMHLDRKEIDAYVLPYLKDPKNMRALIPYSEDLVESLKKYGHILDEYGLKELANWITGTIQDNKDKKYELIIRLLAAKGASISNNIIPYFPIDDKEFTDKYLTSDILAGLLWHKPLETLNKIGIEKIGSLNSKDIIKMINSVLNRTLPLDSEQMKAASRIINYVIRNRTDFNTSSKIGLLMGVAGYPGEPSDNRIANFEKMLENIDKVNPDFLKEINVGEALNIMKHNYAPEEDMFEDSETDDDGKRYDFIREDDFREAMEGFRGVLIEIMIKIIRHNPQVTNGDIFDIIDVNYELPGNAYNFEADLFTAVINSGKKIDNDIVGFIANEIGQSERDKLVSNLTKEQTQAGFNFLENFDEDDFQTIFRLRQKDVLAKFEL